MPRPTGLAVRAAQAAKMALWDPTTPPHPASFPTWQVRAAEAAKMADINARVAADKARREQKAAVAEEAQRAQMKKEVPDDDRTSPPLAPP